MPSTMTTLEIADTFLLSADTEHSSHMSLWFYLLGEDARGAATTDTVQFTVCLN